MIKLLSLFSGIGAFECALRKGGHEFQTINYCEIDKYASAAYSMIHNVDESLNLHDVRKVSTLLFPDVDLVTYVVFRVKTSALPDGRKVLKTVPEIARVPVFFSKH